MTPQLQELLKDWKSAYDNAGVNDSAVAGKWMMDSQDALSTYLEAEPSRPVEAAGPNESWITNVIRDVAELPDRDSPEDWPESMVVTGPELEAIIKHRLLEVVPAPPTDPAHGKDGNGNHIVDPNEMIPRADTPTPDTVLRCHRCQGTIVWKKTDEGFEVYHHCNGKGDSLITEGSGCVFCDIGMKPNESGNHIVNNRIRGEGDAAIPCSLIQPPADTRAPAEPPKYWLLWFDDKDCVDEIFTDREAAQKRYDLCSLSWSCTLFASINPTVKESLSVQPGKPAEHVESATGKPAIACIKCGNTGWLNGPGQDGEACDCNEIGRPAEPVREWRILWDNGKTWRISESVSRKAGNLRTGTPQYSIDGGITWQDADTSAAEGTK